MPGLFAGVRLPMALNAKPTAGLVMVEPLEVETGEVLGFGGYAEDFLAGLGAEPLAEAPQPRTARLRKVQG